MRTVIILGDVADWTDRLVVECRKCDRRGVLSVVRLVQEHGPRMPMTELRRLLAGDCERFKAAKAHDPCDCHFPELARLFGGGGRLAFLRSRRITPMRSRVPMALLTCLGAQPIALGHLVPSEHHLASIVVEVEEHQVKGVPHFLRPLTTGQLPNCIPHGRRLAPADIVNPPSQMLSWVSG
jgi:hypothetical protein